MREREEDRALVRGGGWVHVCAMESVCIMVWLLDRLSDQTTD